MRRGLADSDAGCDGDLPHAIPIFHNSEVGTRTRQILGIVALPCDAERLAQSAGARCDLPEPGDPPEIVRPVNFKPSRLSHLLDTGHRFQCAKQHAASNTIRQARNVQAIMIAIYEVNVGKPRRPKYNEVARRFAGDRMRRVVVFSKIGFGFDNPSGKNSARSLPDKQLPQQCTRHLARIAIEERRL